MVSRCFKSLVNKTPVRFNVGVQQRLNCSDFLCIKEADPGIEEGV